MNVNHTSGILALAFAFATAGQGEENDPRLAFGKDFKPFLAKYCFDCHGAETQKAGVDLQGLLGDEPPKIEDRREWETVMEIILSREMPPEKKPQPAEALRGEMVDYLEAHLESFDCSGPVNPGTVTARRLNRVEYENTIRDLLGVEFAATENFPRDEVGYGFDNIGDVLSLSPLLMEKYLEAAETIVDDALLSEVPPWPPRQRFEETAMKARPRNGDDDALRVERNRYFGLFREGEAEFAFNAPEAGDYQIRVRAYQDKAGPEPALLSLWLGKQRVNEAHVRAEGDAPEVLEFPLTLTEGDQTLAVGYENNYNNSDADERRLRGDRNLYVDWVEVVGPLGKERPPLPATHVAIIPERPQPGREMAMARTIFERFVSRAYRRPATKREVDRLAGLAIQVMDEGATFEEGIKVGVSAVLVSPHFLYRWELDPQRSGEEPRPLNGYELASRLSYFLWSSMPDAELTAAAAADQLGDLDVLRAHLKRMLADPRAKALVQNFTGQWLQTRNLATVEPDPEVFPEFDEPLREAMQLETELFVQSIVDEDRSVLELLDADYTFLNERLAQHYGIPGVTGEAFQRVALDRGSRRGGVLTQASVLTITSEASRTSPVVRGKWVLEQLLNTPPPPPPPDVEPLEETKEAHESASLRERLEQHRDNPDCRGCHAKMDPIGFALENYDAIGRWRDMDGKFPIDPASELVGGITVEGPDDLKRALVQKEDYIEALAEKMLTYALGRGTEYYDKCAIDLIVAQLKGSEYRFSSLIDAIVTSEPFLKRQLLPHS